LSGKPAIIKKMLFQKSLLRELRSAAGGVLAVLLTVLVTMTLIRILGRAASGRIDSELVVPLIVFNTVSLMHTVLLLTVYIAVLIVLTRWWKDSEMVIWFSAGKGLTDVIAPVLRFVLPVMVLVALLSMFASPWAREQISSFEEEIRGRGDAQRLSPGQFRESLSGQRVFFLETPDDEAGKTGKVFVRSIEPSGLQTIIVSSTGRFEKDAEGQQWAVLEKGYRTDYVPGGLESRTMGFEMYRIRLEAPVANPRVGQSLATTGTFDLLSRDDAASKGEVAMRLGFPLLTLALAILAIPLSVTSARTGRATNLIIALLIYVTASNFFNIIKSMLAQGKLGFAVAWWLLPAIMLALAAVLFWWRSRQRAGFVDWLLRLSRKSRPPDASRFA
jgi:lipopolysaccharide export system permease protein